MNTLKILKSICLIPCFSVMLSMFVIGQTFAATYYASPAGGGNGSSSSSPFRINQFWPVASPGDTLLLLDGVYKGSNSMIDPPDYLSGSAGNPITVKALNDGEVEIDGEYARNPVLLKYNDYFA